MDMYHAHKSTKRHDKVYALLGMSLDDLSKADLLPNYRVPWGELLQRLTKFVLSKEISVETWGDKEIVVIKSKGCILGKVTSVQSHNIAQDDSQGVDVTFKNTLRGMGEWGAHWALQVSAKPIKDGDLICLLQGASKPTIIRLCKDYFAIIMIAVTPPEDVQTDIGCIKRPKTSPMERIFTRDFLLVWNWENSLDKLQDPGDYRALTQTNNRMSEHLETELEGCLDKATRTWNVALILGDLEEYKKAEERVQEAIEGYKMVFEEEHSCTLGLGSQYGQTPLVWAAENGYDTVVNLLLAKEGIDPDLKDTQYGRTPLSWAVQGGHESLVKLLLETGKVDVDSKDRTGQTPLWLAAHVGYEAVVKLLLETGKVDVDSKDGVYERTQLSWAAQGGHEAVVKLLLETGKVDIESRDSQYRRTPLSWAADGGHEAVVRLLLETNKVAVDSKGNEYGWTPLSLAAEGGYEAIVKLLLGTEKVDVDLKDPRYGRTPLSRAALTGSEAVVKLLVDTGKVDIDSKDSQYGQTPLPWAAENGHETVVKLLLETGKVDVDSKGSQYGQTPLMWAAGNGHKAVVKLLLETGKVDVNSKDSQYKQTPLSWAKKNGHEAVVKLLQLYLDPFPIT
jgi:ankyrin repeat protein